MPYTVVPAIVDGDDVVDDFPQAVKAAVEEINGGIAGDNSTAPTWTPAWTNLSVGNGTVTARHWRIGPLVGFYLQLIFGSTTSVTGAIQVTVPVTIFGSANQTISCSVTHTDTSAGLVYPGAVAVQSSTLLNVRSLSDPAAGANAIQQVAAAANTPFTWASTDRLEIAGSYLGA